jgi:hypothetical protein
LLTMLLVRVAGGCVAVALIRAGVPAGGRGGSRCGHSFAAGVLGGMMGCAVLGSAGSISGGDHAGWGS